MSDLRAIVGIAAAGEVAKTIVSPLTNNMAAPPVHLFWKEGEHGLGVHSPVELKQRQCTEGYTYLVTNVASGQERELLFTNSGTKYAMEDHLPTTGIFLDPQKKLRDFRRSAELKPLGKMMFVRPNPTGTFGLQFQHAISYEELPKAIQGYVGAWSYRKMTVTEIAGLYSKGYYIILTAVIEGAVSIPGTGVTFPIGVVSSILTGFTGLFEYHNSRKRVKLWFKEHAEAVGFNNMSDEDLKSRAGFACEKSAVTKGCWECTPKAPRTESQTWRKCLKCPLFCSRKKQKTESRQVDMT